MNVKTAAVAVAMAMVMMTVPTMAMLPSEDVFADSGSTYAVGLVEGTPYDYSPTFNLSDVTVEISGSAATCTDSAAPPISLAMREAGIMEGSSTPCRRESTGCIQFASSGTITIIPIMDRARLPNR